MQGRNNQNSQCQRTCQILPEIRDILRGHHILRRFSCLFVLIFASACKEHFKNLPDRKIANRLILLHQPQQNARRLPARAA